MSSTAARNRADTSRGSLREFAARGAVINGLFMIGLALIALLRGFVVAIFLGTDDYGVWGIVVVTLGSLVRLRDVGIGDKFIQQDEEDQELAFQRAFTLELTLALASMVVLGALIPLFAAAYGQDAIIAPSLAMLAVLPAIALSSPLWVYYRQMRFLRQRALQAIDPVVAFVVTVALAAGGAGYWAFVIGTLAGAWCMAIATLVDAPIKLRLRFSSQALRSYASFSWPLFASGLAALVLAQSSAFATNAHLGIAAVGAVALAANLTQFANRVQVLVEAALYPAVCAVKDRVELLRESFEKSNRLGMMWGIPFGIGLSLFCADLVHYGIGEKWEPAVTLLEFTGATVAMSQMCFNWDAYFRALANTKPIAVVTWSAAVSFLVVGIPLLLVLDLRGLAIGIAVQALVSLVLRMYYVKRLFGSIGLVRHTLYGVLPVVPGAAVVLAMRAIESSRSLGLALAELALFVVITGFALWKVDGPLLREFAGYLRRPRGQAVEAGNPAPA